jgi:DEAD/DEAH box helicase domain-containing protein
MSRAHKILTAAVGDIVERIVMAPRPERCLPIPSPYCDGATGKWVREMASGRSKLWRHQTLALKEVAAGKNVVVATGTASGKSLVFTAPLVHELLTGAGKAIVFYPQKALGGDQLRRFRAALEKAGLDPDLVGVIHGDIGGAERDRVIRCCKIVLATPDVFHAWFMPQVQSPIIRDFLSQLRFVVLDEAHVLEGVFGSNAAFLFRRLRAAHAQAAGSPAFQWIAASATIDKPEEHLEKLVGQPFIGVVERENGAPFHGLTLMHISGPERGVAAERLLSELCSTIAGKIAPNALIAFADSRQGVEHVAEYIGREDVVPYRGGYEAEDRQMIEALLQANELRGVISTSALELGIDIPQLEIGINLGIPQTKKQLRQRIGRIGRAMPGAFAVIAPATAFAQLGGTFREYIEAEVEPSRLYLDNRCIQVQAARCLLEECANEEDTQALPLSVEWPVGFAEMFSAARPGAIRPRDLDQLLAIGADSPHYAFPLRAMRETEYALRSVRNPSERIGKIDLEKALREAYPGATYYHMRRAYRVAEWRSTAYEHSIMLEPTKASAITQPLISSTVSVSTAAGELIDNHRLSGEGGQIAEILLKVADSVVGYRCGSAVHLYKDLKHKNWRLRRWTREFASTGVVLQIQQPWFTGISEHAVQTRKRVSEAISAVLAREHGIAPSEVRTAHSSIAVYTPTGPRVVNDAIVIFDNIVGGLRLTSPVFSHFGAILDRLDRASSIAGTDAILSETTVQRLRDWSDSLRRNNGEAADAAGPPPDSGPPGMLMIFAPGSTVGARVRGSFQERKLLAPKIVRVSDNDVLGYDYECEGGSGWLPHDYVEPIGHDWRHVYWSPVSNEIQEVAA